MPDWGKLAAVAGPRHRQGWEPTLLPGTRLRYPGMRHERHYTVEQATAALGAVAQALHTMRDARERLTDAEVREALSEAAPTNGGGSPGRHVSEAFLELRAAAARLQQMEIVLRDLDRGLVDFPAVLDGREVYLCWVESEESAIEYWHDLDAGYAGREPL
jgi:hypothetical protein